GMAFQGPKALQAGAPESESDQRSPASGDVPWSPLNTIMRSPEASRIATCPNRPAGASPPGEIGLHAGLGESSRDQTSLRGAESYPAKITMRSSPGTYRALWPNRPLEMGPRA